MPVQRQELSDSVRLGPVCLRVRDPEASCPLWVDTLGLEALHRAGGAVELGAGGTALVRLAPGAARARVDRTVGLFHIAVNLPTRLDLGRVTARLLASGRRVTGQDHLLSESIYVTDDDGLNIEIYVATPDRGHVACVDGRVDLRARDGSRHSGLEPLDLNLLTAEVVRYGTGDGKLPPGTSIGHVHFRSNAPEAAVAFYTDVLGFRSHILSETFGMFDCGTQSKPHMIAFNVWAGRGLPGGEPDSAGLLSFSISMPPADMSRANPRLAAAGYEVIPEGEGFACRDPDGNRVILSPRPP